MAHTAPSTPIHPDSTHPTSEEKTAETFPSFTTEMRGQSPNYLHMLGKSMPPLEHDMEMAHEYLADSSNPALLAFIRHLASWRDKCEYHIDLNEGTLNNTGISPETARATFRSTNTTALSEREKTMLFFLLKAADTPEAITSNQFQSLRAQGWNNRDILDAICQAILVRTFGTMAHAFNQKKDNIKV